MAKISISLGPKSGGNNITKTSQLVNDGQDGTSTYVQFSDIPSGITNLDAVITPTNITITSDTGNDATIPLASGINAGLINSIEKGKIASAVQPGDLSTVATTGNYNDLGSLPNLSLKENKSEKGQPLGYGSLDINGKQPLSEVNDALLGNVHWKGIYNGTIIVSSPDPLLVGLALPSPSNSNTGWYFISQGSFTNSSIPFETGDWIISNGIAWGKVDNTDAVSSVNGQTGNVTILQPDWNASSGQAHILNLPASFPPSAHTHTESEIVGLVADLASKITSNTPITGATKTKITYDSKGLVLSGTDATTADINDSPNKRYVTDGNLTTIGNQTGINSGDETTSTIKTKLGQATSIGDGWLSQGDWNIFNNKQSAINLTTLGSGIATFVGNTLNIPTPSIPTVNPSALSKTDDTNVTLTLTGTPGSALLQAVNLSLGWSGTLADSRIASASTWNAKASTAYVDAKVQNSLAASTTIAPSATAVNTGLGLKQDKTAWVDYSTTSTIVGWSGTPTVSIRYLVEGKKLTYIFSITGTSNSSTSSFTTHLPAGANLVQVFYPARCQNSGVYGGTPGSCTIIPSTNVVNVYTNYTPGTFTPSGVKTVMGMIIFEID